MSQSKTIVKLQLSPKHSFLGLLNTGTYLCDLIDKYYKLIQMIYLSIGLKLFPFYIFVAETQVMYMMIFTELTNKAIKFYIQVMI